MATVQKHKRAVHFLLADMRYCNVLCKLSEIVIDQNNLELQYRNIATIWVIHYHEGRLDGRQDSSHQESHTDQQLRTFFLFLAYHVVFQLRL